jgi:CHAT domain-containing protein
LIVLFSKALIMETSPPPSGANLDNLQRKTMGLLLRQMQEAKFDRNTLMALQWPMVERLATTFSDECAVVQLSEELENWVRWYRLPGLWLTYLFQLLLQQLGSAYHVLACCLYSEAQANLNEDLAYPSMENAFLGAVKIKAAGINGFEAVEQNLRTRLKTYYDFYYNLNRPQDYMAVNPLVCHLYTIIVLRRFQEAFPDIGDPSRQLDPKGLKAVIDNCTDMDRLYYRVLARRFLGLHYETKHAYLEAVREYELALQDAIPVRLETEIGHLHRHCAAALLNIRRCDEAVAHLEKACTHETLPDFAYWHALSAYKLGDAQFSRLTAATAESDPSRPGAGTSVAIDLDRDRKILQHVMETYRRGRIAFESGLPSPVPVARAVKQQLYRSFHENSLKTAQVLGDWQNLLAELEAGGPRQATELVAEIEGCRSATPDAVREFRKVRALFFSGLSTVAGDFAQYSQALFGNNPDRQSYMKSYVSLTRLIRQAQMSDPIAEQVLKLRIPGMTFLLFNVGWNESSITLLDVESGRLVASGIGPFGYRELQTIQQRYREGLSRESSDRGPLFKEALDQLLSDYQALLCPIFANLHSFLKGRHVKIFPRAQLNAVPMHALKMDGKFLLEHCTVSYGQTLGLFLKIHERTAAKPAALKVMTVYNDQNLPFYDGVIGNLEKEDSVRNLVLINPSFPQLLDAVKKEAPSDLLFACHGAYAQNDPENSRLMFGNPDGTSFWQIFSELDLTGSRSVVLGACESGLSRAEVDAEYLGFTGAFHSAGADYVLGSLWQVNQLSTAILIDRYFELLENTNANRPEALRCAQKDLMRMARADVIDWVSKNCRKMPIALLRQVLKSIQRLDPEPFAHPQWWAGFFISGA